MKKKCIVTGCLIISLSLFCNETQAEKKKENSSPPPASSEIFGSLAKAKHIFGPEVTQADLKSKVGEEAKALLDAADKYLEKKKEKLLSEASTTPSSALGKMIIYAKSVHGLKYEKEIAERIAELKKDASLKKLMNFRKEIEKYNAKLAKRNSSSTRKALEKVKANVQKLIDNKSTTPAVINEAKTLL